MFNPKTNRKGKFIWLLFILYSLFFLCSGLYISIHLKSFPWFSIPLDTFLYLLVGFFTMYLQAEFTDYKIDTNSEEYKEWSKWYRGIVINFFEKQKEQNK